MRCPECGYKSKTLDTREYRKNPGVMRRKECLRCRHRFRSFEINEADYTMMLANKKVMDEIASVIERREYGPVGDVLRTMQEGGRGTECIPQGYNNRGANRNDAYAIR